MVFRTVAAVFFVTIGVFTGLIFAFLGTPSFWYIVAAALLASSGIIWLFDVSLGASFALPPTAALMVLLHYFIHQPIKDLAIVIGLFACAAILIFFGLRARSSKILPIVLISTCLLVAGFAVDRLFTDVVSIRSVEMTWLPDGNAPWGEVGPTQRANEPVVVLYRKMNDGYCYEAIYSSAVLRRLVSENKNPVTVQYNTFKTFGRITGFNLRSIDGIVLNDGKRPVLAIGDEESGYIETSTSAEACW